MRAIAVSMLVACAVTILLAPVAMAQGMRASTAESAVESPEHLRRAAELTAVSDLVYARPFVLRESYPYTWLSEQPLISAGHLLVLAVDPEVARPRQVDVPILYAGDTPAQLTNTGFPSGYLIVVVPDWIDLRVSPVFFGSTGLPEQIGRAYGQREMETAVARGVEPFATERLAAAEAEGGDTLLADDAVALMRAVADLIEIYAPEEQELAEIYRTPLVGE
jgi:hypothetical protein